MNMQRIIYAYSRITVLGVEILSLFIIARKLRAILACVVETPGLGWQLPAVSFDAEPPERLYLDMTEYNRISNFAMW